MIDYCYYRYRFWEILASFGDDIPFGVVFPLWLPAIPTFVLLASIIFSLWRRRRLGRWWWYACLPAIAVATSALVFVAAPVFAISDVGQVL
jgi:hypothetical protein